VTAQWNTGSEKTAQRSVNTAHRAICLPATAQDQQTYVIKRVDEDFFEEN